MQLSCAEARHGSGQREAAGCSLQEEEEAGGAGQLGAHHQAWLYLSCHCELFNPCAEGLNMFNSFTFVLSYTDFLFQKFPLLRATAKLGAQCPLGTPGGEQALSIPGEQQVPCVPWEPRALQGSAGTGGLGAAAGGISCCTRQTLSLFAQGLSKVRLWVCPSPTEGAQSLYLSLSPGYVQAGI